VTNITLLRLRAVGSLAQTYFIPFYCAGSSPWLLVSLLI